MKIKLVVRDAIIAIRFDEKSFFSTILGFTSENGLRQPILFSFVSDKPAVYKFFANLKQFITKKMNKSVFNTIKFYRENDKNEENEFNQEVLTLQYK